jgi:hypothetical protein
MYRLLEEYGLKHYRHVAQTIHAHVCVLASLEHTPPSPTTNESSTISAST